MENRAQDYYDIPSELLPTPNFANRPSSEISMLDGMTFMMSSSSSSDDDEGNTTAQPQSQDKLLEWTLSRPEIPERPKITITAPSEDDSVPLSRGSSSDSESMDRPQLKRKAPSAPTGALRPPKYIPLQPRRALSEPLGLAKIIKGRIPQHVPFNRSPWPGRSILGEESAEPRRPLPPVPGQTEILATSQRIGKIDQISSFSGKARVKGTLKKKQMGMLNTGNVNLEPKRSPNTPNSILSTPREMYGIPEHQTVADSVPSPRSQSQRSTVSRSPSTRSTPDIPDMKSRDEEVAIVSRGASLLRRQRVYEPGPIRLEEHPTKPRVDSVADSEPFDAAITAKTSRFSDMVALDGIVMFFEDFGVVDQVSEETLDKYWLDDQPKDLGVGVKRTTSKTSIAETASKHHRKARIHRVSRFSFSSGSSSASTHPIGAAKRQRIRLRRLLSPALPGSAFRKDPAYRGQKTGSS
ncbi:Nn.00g057770.m01.CDS01 [Neocucurbitaria sp. VM-36]